MRRTKIVCTIGPASESVETLKRMMQAGMDIARLNFSHGSYEEHGARIQNIRQASAEVGKMIGIMLDIKGPKIRTGLIENGEVELHDGDTIVLTTDEVLGTAQRVSISYEGLPEDVAPGSILRIDDGLIGLVVVKVEGNDIHCSITNGGVLKNRKGINAPGVKLRIPSVTEKDIADIKFGIEQGIDIIAASFVRKASDVLDIRKLLEEAGANIDIISKIEAQEGLDLLDEIIEVSDGLMVARGDLGVEIPTEEVPLAQKMMIEKCNRVGKPVITATQMLDSMQRNPRPTRAEASDVANAIFDGTDAIMLSGESAAGQYPIEAVLTMAQIAERAERAIFTHEIQTRRKSIVEPKNSITDAISHAVETIADDLDAKAIITPTQGGYTARMISKHRPTSPIIAVTQDARVARKLCVSWGVQPVLIETNTESTDEMLSVAVDGALSTGLVKSGDLVVITAGVPVGQTGTTNLIKVHTIGDIVAKGTGIGKRAANGRVVFGTDPKELINKVKAGDVLVTRMTDADFVPFMDRCSAIITEEGGLTSHAAVVGLSLGIPVVVGVERATEVLKDHEYVTVDVVRGLIYKGIAQVL